MGFALSRFLPIFAIVLLFWQTPPLLAADAAERTVLGFSSDGRYFGFEQFGVQDGSGFPYAEVVIVDLDHDRWVDGTPVRVLLEDEQRTVGAARREAMASAQPLIARLGITEPGTILAANTIYQANIDPRRLRFLPYYRSLGNIEPVAEDDEDALTLRLEEIVLPSPAECPVDDAPRVGFVLGLARGSDAPEEVFRDQSIPASRGCPLAYSLSDMVAFGYGAGGYARYVALINVFSHGFEGANRRFLAVAIR
jgi:predicted secreted protein